MTDKVESGTSWLMAVAEQRGERIPLLALQPEDAQYESVRTRLVKAGFSRLSRAEWERAAWPHSPTTAVDVADGRLIRFTNGTTSFYCAAELEVGPMWLATGQERGKALIVLLPADWVAEEDGAEGLPERALDAATQRRLWAATGAFRVDAIRLRGPGWKRGPAAVT